MARCRLVLACFNFFGHGLACLRMLSVTHNFHTHHLSHTTLSHTPFLFVTHHLSHTTLSHTTLHIQLVLLLDHPSHSLPVPPATFVDHYWKELTCGVIRSFNFKFQISCCGWAHDILSRRLPLKNTQKYRCIGRMGFIVQVKPCWWWHWFIDSLIN